MLSIGQSKEVPPLGEVLAELLALTRRPTVCVTEKEQFRAQLESSVSAELELFFGRQLATALAATRQRDPSEERLLSQAESLFTMFLGRKEAVGIVDQIQQAVYLSPHLASESAS